MLTDISSMSAPLPFAAFHAEIQHAQNPLRAAITAAYRCDEREAVQRLLSQISYSDSSQVTTQTFARKLIAKVREKRSGASGFDALMHEFSLSSDEGIALMCLAEALLRIPDHQTADRLIADKISKGDWRKHLGVSPSLFVNAATWGLVITGKLVRTSSEHGLGSALTRLIAKGGEPLIRKGVDLAMRMLGDQFVIGRTIAEALAKSHGNEARGYRYSYDMLGEAALTTADAKRYYSAYEAAIHAIGLASNGRGIRRGPGISVKLSALHPRYSRSQRSRVMTELLPRLKTLLLLAKQYDIAINIDAEEADRLELSLDLIEALAFDADLAGFDGLGVVVQAYQKRAPFVIDYLVDLAARSRRKFMVRLVKGAYWDMEIKRAQVDGMPGYPVFTRKAYTDVCYLLCAQKLLAAIDVIYPQFATHNANTMATIYQRASAQKITDYEFQCLHGMGEPLYDQIVGKDNLGIPCRIYAPVGSHETLLAYLVRRLLENGANSSFVNQIVDENISIDTLVTDPVGIARQLGGEPHPNIPLPVDLYGTERRNSAGIDLTDESMLREIDAAFAQLDTKEWRGGPLLDAVVPTTESRWIRNPANHHDIVGRVIDANAVDVDIALAVAHTHASDWSVRSPAARAGLLLHASDLFEAHRFELIALAIRETGKSLPNAVAEVREAVDFLRYYAAQIRSAADALPLGPVVCISPWNFPLSIFTGQVAASLAAGNVVLAKPAEQSPLIACRAVQLLHEAGVPRSALQLLPGDGAVVGARLIADPRVRGVLFTGSLEIAQSINRVLATREVAESSERFSEIPFVAETGGQNTMIVDSSALPEQVVQDVLASAFDSAGQRCSALRVLCLQTEVADRILVMLRGAMEELRIGDPASLATDVGPVIDADARHNLIEHIERMKSSEHNVYQLPLNSVTSQGTFVAPTILEITSLTGLEHEVFGPVLHVLRYKRDELPQLVDEINAIGFGLTLGIHTRIDETIDYIVSNARVGNIYVNRSIVGAVVGVQPFGGEGKSGTGPKAGGSFYLNRLQQNPTVKFNILGIESHTQSDMHQQALSELLMWARTHGREHLATIAEQYIEVSGLHVTATLRGPTGEQNTLSLAPRGNVLCTAISQDTLLNQLAAVFATGNCAYILTTEAWMIAQDWPSGLRDRIRLVEIAELSDVVFHAALMESSQAALLRPLLAERAGAVVSVTITTKDVPIPLWRLLTERSVCVNATAAGGNSSLTTLRE